MEKHSDVEGKSEFYQWGFADVMTVYNLGKKIGGDKLNQKSYLDFMKNIEGEKVFMGGELSKKSAPEAAPQIIQPTIRIVQYKGGKVVPVSDGFFNPLERHDLDARDELAPTPVRLAGGGRAFGISGGFTGARRHLPAMATIVLDAYREIRRSRDPSRPACPRCWTASRRSSRRSTREAALDEILHLVARKICMLVECSRCGVYLKHSDTGLYRGQVIESSHEAATSASAG